MTPTRIFPFVLALAICSTAVRAQGAKRVTTPPVKAAAPAAAGGFYSAQQATNGEHVFASVCIECHARKDMSNPDFRLKWSGRTVNDLFERVRTTMPESAPGSLSRDEYLNVVAYLLKLNGMPAGAKALVVSPAMKQMRLMAGSTASK